VKEFLSPVVVRGSSIRRRAALVVCLMQRQRGSD
jgi:hypothetical protein